VKKQFRELLHRYKVEAFKLTHHAENGAPSALASEIVHHTEEALNNAYHYHFHQDPNPDRLETFTMIKNFTLEALLPPVVEKVMRRVVQLEKQQQLMFQLVDELLEVLSEEEGPVQAREVG